MPRLSVQDIFIYKPLHGTMYVLFCTDTYILHPTKPPALIFSHKYISGRDFPGRPNVRLKDVS